MKTPRFVARHALAHAFTVLVALCATAAQAQLGVGDNLGIRVAPTQVNFPDTEVGQSTTRPIAVEVTGFVSADGRTYSVEFSQPNNAGFRVERGSCPAAGSGVSIAQGCELQAVFSPQSAVSSAGVPLTTVTVTLSGETGGTLSLGVTASGVGVAPSGPRPLPPDIVDPADPRTENADAVEQACTDATSVDEQACADLATAAEQNPESAAQALQEITPEKASKANVAVQQIARVQGRLIGNRIAALRRGATGVSVAGLSFNINGQEASAGDLASAFQPLGGGASGDDSAEAAGGLLAGSRWGAFLSGQLSRGDKDETVNTSGFDFENNVLTAGVDYRVSNNVFLGLAASLVDGENDIDADGGSLDTEGATFTVYGSWYSAERLALDFSASWGSAEYDQTRRMRYDLLDGAGNIFQSADQLFDASYDGESVGASLAASWKLVQTQWDIDLRASLDYLNSELDAFSETSRGGGYAAGYAVTLDDQEQTWLTGTATLAVRYVITPSWGVLVPFLEFDAIHEFDNEARTLTARFNNSLNTAPLLVRTDDPDTDYFRVRVGASMQLPGSFAASLDYGRLFAFDNWSEYTLSAGLRYEF